MRPLRRPLALSLAAVLVIVVAVAVIASLRNGRVAPLPSTGGTAGANPFDMRPKAGSQHVASADAAGDLVVEKFCGTCHGLPPADCEPRSLWPQKIEEMYTYAQAGRAWPQTQMPTAEQAAAYWTSRAPEALTLPPEITGSPPSPVRFERRLLTLAGIPNEPAVSCVSFVRLTDDSPVQLLISDMRHGVVLLWTPSRTGEPAKVIGRVSHPSRPHVVDLDGDGIRDILIANLGVFWNVDTDQGSIVWLRGRGNEQFEPFVLIDHISRVNEVQTADFDGDGDLDIVAAVFGNFTTGMIAYLENFTEDYAAPDFEAISLDGHTGTSDVPVVDLNRDGRPDFVALQSQEHERIVAFLNARHGRFNTEVIYAAPHPRWGSTGIKLFDLDGDGDEDLLFNHGDSIQFPPVLRPYHGISWLENEGRFPFTYHRLAHFPGAHTSQPADLDGDGDADLISSAFIPAVEPAGPLAPTLESVIWLCQTAPGQYQRYALEKGLPFHPCLDAGDLDGDGDIDIVLGNFTLSPGYGVENAAACLTVLENQATRPTPTAATRPTPPPR